MCPHLHNSFFFFCPVLVACYYLVLSSVHWYFGQAKKAVYLTRCKILLWPLLSGFIKNTVYINNLNIYQTREYLPWVYMHTLCQVPGGYRFSAQHMLGLIVVYWCNKWTNPCLLFIKLLPVSKITCNSAEQKFPAFFKISTNNFVNLFALGFWCHYMNFIFLSDNSLIVCLKKVFRPGWPFFVSNN